MAQGQLLVAIYTFMFAFHPFSRQLASTTYALWDPDYTYYLLARHVLTETVVNAVHAALVTFYILVMVAMLVLIAVFSYFLVRNIVDLAATVREILAYYKETFVNTTYTQDPIFTDTDTYAVFTQ